MVESANLCFTHSLRFMLQTTGVPHKRWEYWRSISKR